MSPMQYLARYLAAFLFGLVFCKGEIQGQPLTFTTLAGGTQGTNDGLNAAAQLDFPAGIARHTNGNLFIADLMNNTIRQVTPVGDDWMVTTIAGLPSLGLIGA